LHSGVTSFGMLKRMRRIRRVRPVLPPPSAFTGFRFPREVIVLAVRWYLRYGLSYRDVEELLAERGVQVDHVSVFRWVQRFTPLLAEVARACRHRVGTAGELKRPTSKCPVGGAMCIGRLISSGRSSTCMSPRVEMVARQATRTRPVIMPATADPSDTNPQVSRCDRIVEPNES
jgi:hypothetical protein